MYWQIVFGVVILLLLIPTTRPHAQYFLAYITYGAVVTVGSVVYGILFYIRGGPRYENSCEFCKVYRLARRCMGLEPRIYGLELYDPDRQCVYVCNHQSFIDILSIVDLWKCPSTIIAKSSLKYFGPLGAILYYSKVILINRSSHAQAISELNRTAEIIKKDKANLFMFPEGTRGYSGHIMPFKKGAFHLAIQTQLPIQPIVVSCYNSFLDHKNYSFKPVPYGVYLLPAIPTTGMEQSQVNELIDRTHAAMSEIFELTAKASREELGTDLRSKLK
ncbi:hypothetical protein Aperf_G00000098020 [Anoplocephala perfoliata]